MDGCIETTNARDHKGYGYCDTTRFGKRIRRGHILAWIDANGMLPPPDKPHVLHRCDNPPCINPDHLWVGTHTDNMRDKVAKGRDFNKNKTHCPRSHEYDERNTYYDSLGHRFCRACRALQARRLRAEAKVYAE